VTSTAGDAGCREGDLGAGTTGSSRTTDAPAFAEQGENAENWFTELKLQADVALIGFPKSESPR